MIKLRFRKANSGDTDLYYKWSNDKVVRENSFQKSMIRYEDHVSWFSQKLTNENCNFYLFLDSNDVPVGQVRIDKSNNETIIGLSIDSTFRGQGLGTAMIQATCDDYFITHPDAVIVAYIKEQNVSSFKIFEKAGFNEPAKIFEEGSYIYRLIKRIE